MAVESQMILTWGITLLLDVSTKERPIAGSHRLARMLFKLRIISAPGLLGVALRVYRYSCTIIADAGLSAQYSRLHSERLVGNSIA